MGSSVDDFLKGEGIFEEAQAQAVKEVVAWQFAEAMKKKNLEEQNGHTAEDQPHAGGPASECKRRHHAFEPAASRGDGGPPRHD
jgi:hypothetical protein